MSNGTIIIIIITTHKSVCGIEARDTAVAAEFIIKI